MDNQNLIIFKFETFYKIFKELEQNTTFKSFEVSDYKMLQEKKVPFTPGCTMMSTLMGSP